MNLSSTFLNQQRLLADAKADELIHSFFANGFQNQLYSVFSIAPEQFESLQNEALKAFLIQTLPKPDWLEVGLLRKGQRVFEKYALPIMNLLGGLSLPYCYAASPGNKALFLSEKMRKQPGKRLADTAEFIIGVSAIGQLDADASGHFHINKTRLIHAIARFHILKGNEWNLDWGLPINQEDMAGTNLAFSFLILRGLIKSGFLVSEKEKEAFLHLWRYIGYQLRIDAQLLPSSFEEAILLERAIRTRHFKKSEEGVALTKELIACFKNLLPENESTFIAAQMRYWLGKSVANCVGLKPDMKADATINLLNTINEARNFLTLKETDFRKMLQNQALLKLQVSQQRN